jgi:hypothetical protein
MRPFIVAALCLSLTACGADVAVATATTAKLQAEQAKQAKETAAQLTQKLDASIKAGEQRSADAAEEKR